MIIKGIRKLKECYHQIGPGDVYIGTVVSSPLMQSMLIDLQQRGVHCIPSPLAQCLSKSKAVQALIFRDWMLPNTRVISRRLDLMDAIQAYNRLHIGPVITKENHMHCGHGVRRWDTIDTLYNVAAFSDASFPFVLQPFLGLFTDVRVIIVGDYAEAYIRHNADNFRKNLSSGGKPDSFDLNRETAQFCRSVMDRGNFAFAHLDVLISEKGETYLSEIALNGGIKGAAINRKELDQKKQVLLNHLANEIHGT
jgi:ribosomal protein S6--L-glutamate ligase